MDEVPKATDEVDKMAREKMAFDRANVITEVRNQLLTEGFKGLIAINAGGATALGAFVQAVWEKPSATPMLSWILLGICWLIAGTALAAVGFVTRHLSFFHGKTHEPFRNPWWWAELLTMILSVSFFMIGMGVAVRGAFIALHCR